jgi:hypothetical protein
MSEEKKGNNQWVSLHSCQKCDTCLCYNTEQTHRILQDAGEKAKPGAQHDPSLDTEDQEESLQLFYKYVTISVYLYLYKVLSFCFSFSSSNWNSRSTVIFSQYNSCTSTHMF